MSTFIGLLNFGVCSCPLFPHHRYRGAPWDESLPPALSALWLLRQGLTPPALPLALHPVGEGFLLTLFPRFWVFLSLLYGGVGGCHGPLKGWPRTHDPVGPRPPQGCRLSLAPQPAALIGGDAEAPRRDSSPAVIGGRRATSSRLRLLRPRPLVVRGKPKANARRVFCGPCYRVFRGWGSGYRLFFRSRGVRSGWSRRKSLPPRAGGYSRGLRETDGGDRGGKRGEPAGQRGCGGKTFTETER